MIKLLRNLAAGALAGGVGTAAMDLLLYERYQRPGGKEGLWRWEFAGDVMSWQDVSAPGRWGTPATDSSRPRVSRRDGASVAHIGAKANTVLAAEP